MNKWGGGRITYLFRRLFGVYNENYWEYLKQRHPVFYRYKVLLPVLPFYRLAYALKKFPIRVKHEIATVIRQENK